MLSPTWGNMKRARQLLVRIMLSATMSGCTSESKEVNDVSSCPDLSQGKLGTLKSPSCTWRGTNRQIKSLDDCHHHRHNSHIVNAYDVYQ